MTDLHIASGPLPANYRLGNDVPKAVDAPRRHWREIVTEIGAEHGVSVAELLGCGRNKRVSQARQHAFSALYDGTRSTEQIGRIFSRDRSTVVHGIRAHAARVAK